MCTSIQQNIEKKLKSISYVPTKIRNFLSTLILQYQNRMPGDNTMDSIVLDFMWNREVEPYGAVFWDEAILADSIILRVDGHYKSTKNGKANDTSDKKKKVKSIMIGCCGARGLPLHPPIFAESENQLQYVELFQNILRYT